MAAAPPRAWRPSPPPARRNAAWLGSTNPSSPRSSPVCRASGPASTPTARATLDIDLGPVSDGGSGLAGLDAETRTIITHVALHDTDPNDQRPAPNGVDGERSAHAHAGRYELLGEIARGGMGSVVRGHDPDLGRDLALKVLLDQHCNHSDLVDRFLEEAQICGQLPHPGVVPVYDLGTLTDHRPFFALARDCLTAQARDRPPDAGVVAGRMTAYLAGVQERLPEAKLSRAAETARAQEAGARASAERQARRLTAVLAATVLLAGVLGGAGWWWTELQRLERVREASGRVNLALQDATRLRGLAQGAAVGELGPWELAAVAAEKARDELAPGVDPALRKQVENLAAELAAERQQAEAAAQAAERDRLLIDRLVDIRSAEADDQGGWSTLARRWRSAPRTAPSAPRWHWPSTALGTGTSRSPPPSGPSH